MHLVELPQRSNAVEGQVIDVLREVTKHDDREQEGDGRERGVLGDRGLAQQRDDPVVCPLAYLLHGDDEGREAHELVEHEDEGREGVAANRVGVEKDRPRKQVGEEAHGALPLPVASQVQPRGPGDERQQEQPVEAGVGVQERRRAKDRRDSGLGESERIRQQQGESRLDSVHPSEPSLPGPRHGAGAGWALLRVPVLRTRSSAARALALTATMRPGANLEIKARCADLAKARAVAVELATETVGVDVQVDTYFVVPRGRMKLRESSLSGGQLVPYLRPDQSGPKRSDYQLVPVPDPARLKALLTEILGVHRVVRKRREIFLVDNVRIHLDEVEGLGSFLELEAVFDGSAAALQGEQRKVDALMQALGVAPGDLLEGSYEGMVEPV